MTECAARRPAPAEDLRTRIARHLQPTAGNGDPGAASGSMTAEQMARLRSVLPERWSRAAVLVPLVDRPAEPTVLLTQRATHLTNHPGQISFPGGRMEASDAGPWEAALRETTEEIGLAPACVSLAGYLRDHLVISGYVVTPVVGVVRPEFVLRLDTTEVEDAFEVPLAFVLDPANQRQAIRRIGGESFATWEIPWRGHRIWGATATMLVSLGEALRGS